LEKQEELLAPLRERYEKIHAEISAVNEDSLSERDRVLFNAKRGLLGGIDSSGCLADVEHKAVCAECARALNERQVPKNALMNGTWAGPAPSELTELDSIERSMIAIYNNVTVLKMLPTGKCVCVFFCVVRSRSVFPLYSLPCFHRWGLRFEAPLLRHRE